MKNCKNLFLFISTAAFLATSCGSPNADFKDTNIPIANSPTQSSNSPIDGSGAAWNSFAVTSASLLPKCDSIKSGALAYVRGEKKFYTCDGSTWQVEDILSKDSFAVVEKWKFHVDSYSGEPNLSDESLDQIAHLGDIEILKYANGTASYTISGAMATYTSNNIDAYAENFSYSGLITDLSREHTKIFKFDMNSNCRLRVRINLATSTPRFDAIVDIDGNFYNNIDKVFPLAKDSL